MAIRTTKWPTCLAFFNICTIKSAKSHEMNVSNNKTNTSLYCIILSLSLFQSKFYLQWSLHQQVLSDSYHHQNWVIWWYIGVYQPNCFLKSTVDMIEKVFAALENSWKRRRFLQHLVNFHDSTCGVLDWKYSYGSINGLDTKASLWLLISYARESECLLTAKYETKYNDFWFDFDLEMLPVTSVKQEGGSWKLQRWPVFHSYSLC